METYLSLVSHPSRYLGGEINSVKKDLSRAELTVCLGFPDVYEVGMSHLGLQILYRLLNDIPGIAAERVYAPGLDMERVMREKGIRLASLESRHPLAGFDLVGFSLQYELSYTNVLAMLDLAGIPLRSAQRRDDDPLVIAGGPCAFNPEPLADFFDAVLVGDGEEALPEMCACVIRAKKERMARQEVLARLAQVEGVYVPGFFQAAYRDDATIKEIKPLRPEYRGVKKRWIASLDATPCIRTPLVPYMRIVHDRLNLEIARGCTRGCRFCQAGMIYRPVRERGMRAIEEAVECCLAGSGFDELSLASLSTGDHGCIAGLLTRLMRRYADDKVAISFPSLRSETLTPHLIEQIKKVRKTGFTIAPEAGTDRLRRVINKGNTENEILETVRNVFDAGWNGIKLYFMIGLPGERQEDLEGIVALAAKIRSLATRGGKRRGVAVSVSTFVPKAHTPFQWEGQISMAQMQQKQDFLKREIRKLKLDFKWQEAYMSYLEGIFARGDRRLGAVVEKAYREGCRFDGWSEYLDQERWERALRGVDTRFYVERRRSFDEILPWDLIDCGIKKSYLRDEYEKSMEGVFTPDCRSAPCNGCGICVAGSGLQLASAAGETGGSDSGRTAVLPETDGADYRQPETAGMHRKLRLRFAKLGDGRFLSHLELVTLFSRAVKRAGIPVRFSEGFHPLPRIIFGPALPVGIESEYEYVDMEVVDGRRPEELMSALNRTLPEWVRIRAAQEIPLKCSALSDSIAAVSFVIHAGEGTDWFCDRSALLQERIDRFQKDETRTVAVRTKKGMADIDLKQWVELIALKNGAALELTVKMSGSKTVRPPEILKEVLDLSDDELRQARVKKTGVRFRRTVESTPPCPVGRHEA
jgi:radical SAM family uncharacterized protein/radical SAM-linked protein